MSDLSGKVALVTGGSRGIGAEIARTLAAGGAAVGLTYRSAADQAHGLVKEIRANGGRALAIQADNADPEAVRAAIETTAAEFGGFDILVNNAGVFPSGPLEEVTSEELDHTLATHVRTVFTAAQTASRHMTDGGRIINIGSCLTERLPGPGMTLYAMSKSALQGLTKGLARDLGPRGITAVVVDPGPTDTDMNPAEGPAADFLRGFIAVGHYGHARDVAGMVAYLAGPGGRHVTGNSILVDGGFAA
ncbi:3-oxoacyl-ACP reductase family protein [Streptomyces sp. DASNCL29]|uniref:SDR family NAD(P)-dependent oxidoreductase n=1 Tax=Streptomyces sp. DASNCL29 TaxID=2583819 RepID=UPI00110F9E56|nr:3-oxoacyl-ACP reductase family protein [Streptomyces sp. DASNCL29]TMU89921.1 3-oxoacyl-ACP reductase FabG [Streptomyces sp. DASNCL29]